MFRISFRLAGLRAMRNSFLLIVAIPAASPLKIFDAAKAQGRFLYSCAPMVRYSKLAFRQTVHHYGTDLCWTPMILAKEFNRSAVARDSDLTVATAGGPVVPTIAQFGANSPRELARAAALAAPWVNGVDLNCGCPQSWACAETLGAALMERRDLVRDMVVDTRARLAADGWAVGLTDADRDSPRGRSVSVKIRVHHDLRKTMDFVTTVLGDDAAGRRHVDWLTIHPRTRSTPSSTPINLEALELLTETFGKRVPILVSGDVFTLSSLPYTSHLLDAVPTFTTHADAETGVSMAAAPQKLPHLPNLAGLMSARALLANPALFAGYETCPWEAVDVFLDRVAKAPLPFKLGVHHLTEMTGPGYGPDKKSLLNKKERGRLVDCTNWIDVLDCLEELRREKGASRTDQRGDGKPMET